MKSEQARFRLFDSLNTFLKNAAAAQPLALILDNLHWADTPSLLLLQFLASELRDTRLLVVAASRTAASATDRARVNARNSIAAALKIIRQYHLPLWRHLTKAVKTGTFCRYQPEPVS